MAFCGFPCSSGFVIYEEEDADVMNGMLFIILAVLSLIFTTKVILML